MVAEAYEGLVLQFIEISRRRAEDFASDGFIRERLQGLLRGEARAALLRVRELGAGRVHTYSGKDKTLEKMASRGLWRGRILKAIEEERFESWFQPIVEIREKKTSHYEGLVRLREDDGTIILPGAFIQVAERFALIGRLDRVVAEKIMRVQAESISRGNPVTLSINLSGKSIEDDELLNFIEVKMAETGADPGRLVFEITETAAVRDLQKAARFIRALRTMGCHFALDDFGTGFTSFVYLKQLEVDYIKIDGMFVRNLDKNSNDRLFVKAMADVARGMGVKSVAEMVESEAIFKILAELGVDYAQGNFLSKPLRELPELT